jgi:hypothetical protein
MDLEFSSYRTDPRRVLPIVLGAIAPSVVRKDALVPIAIKDDRIVIAVASLPDPDDDEFFDMIRFVCNREFEFVVVTWEALQYARMRYLFGERG